MSTTPQNPFKGRYPGEVKTIGGRSGEAPAAHIGGEVLAINGKRVAELFAQNELLISASTRAPCVVTW